MKYVYLNTTRTLANNMTRILMLSLLATPVLVRAQHNRFQINTPAPAPSRPAPMVNRPEPRKATPEPRVNRPEPRETRPEPRETRPAAPERRPEVEAPKPAPRVHTPEPPVSRLSYSPAASNIDSRTRATAVHDQPRAATVSREPQSGRVVESRRSDGTRLVSAGRSRGFVERPIAARPGYVGRTYVAGGRSYVRVYRAASFRGFAYYRYVPAVYFRPVFYQWVYNPWPAPIYFAWGWGAAPWYGYYGAYFAPAPVYGTPALWLTDYILAENLKLAYERQMESGELPPPDGQTVALSPEIKQVIAEEVRQQLAAEQVAASTDNEKNSFQAASGEVAPPALDPTQRVFVVSTELDLPGVGGQACALTPGDIILRSTDAIGADGKVGVSVLSSKPGDCAINASSSIDVTALQEMHNQFREQIDSGLTLLAANQGKNGLPKGPAAKPHSATESWAKADGNAASALMHQQADPEAQ